MRRLLALAAQFTVLFVFWLVLSGQYRPLFLGLGAASAAAATAMTHDLVADALAGGPGGGRRWAWRTWRVVAYVGWLLGRIILASVQVAYFVASPSMPLRPAVLRFRTRLRSPLARVVLANSITLVPGTLTMRLAEDEYTVHALVPSAADDLLSARMQNMIGSIFLEEPEPPPQVAWEPEAP